MKKVELRRKVLEDKYYMKEIKKEIIEDIEKYPIQGIKQFQKIFKITNHEASQLLGVTINQIEKIRQESSAQTKKTTILIKLLSQKFNREIKKTASILKQKNEILQTNQKKEYSIQEMKEFFSKNIE